MSGAARHGSDRANKPQEEQMEKAYERKEGQLLESDWITNLKMAVDQDEGSVDDICYLVRASGRVGG